MNQENQHQGQKVINLRDIFFYVLKRWKILVILFIVGAVFGSGYSYYRMKKTTETNKVENRKANLQKLIDSNNTEAFDMERVVRYRSLKEAYETAVYNEDSDHRIKGGDEVWTATKTFYLTTNEANLNGVRSFLAGTLNRNDRLMNLYDSSGTDWTFEEFSSTLAITLKINDLPDNSISTLESSRDGSLTVRVWALEEETVQKYMDILMGYVSEAEEYIREYYPGGYSMVLTADTTVYGVSNIITTLRKNLSDARANAYKAFKEAEAELTSNEKLYYQIYYGTYREKAGGFAKKWPVFGVFGFVFMGLFFIVLYYLTNGRLKNEDDLITTYGQKILAVTKINGKKKDPVTGLIERWESNKKLPENDENYLKALFRLLGDSRTVISGDPQNELINKVKDLAVGSNPAVSAVGCLSSEADAVTAAKEAERIVFVVHFGNTKTINFERELEVAQGVNTPVIGVVAIR